MSTNDLTALAGIYRKQAEESPSEFVRWAHKTVRDALDYMEAQQAQIALSRHALEYGLDELLSQLACSTCYGRHDYCQARDCDEDCSIARIVHRMQAAIGSSPETAARYVEALGKGCREGEPL
jgi:hypothetical protein